MAKALIITKNQEDLLSKTLFDVVGFSQEEVTYIPPGKDINGILARGNYSVVICVGEESLVQFGISGITRLAGKSFDYEGIKVVPILSPSYVRHNTHLFEKFARDLDVAKSIMLGLGEVELKNQFIVVTDFTQLLDLVTYIKKVGYVSFDFETTKLTDMGTFSPDFFTTCVSFSFQQGSAYVLPLYHFQSPNDEAFIHTCVKELEKEVFDNPDVTKIGHNVKFDLHCAAHIGIKKLSGAFHDTMVMHHLMDADSPHGLKDLVRRYYSRFANYEDAIVGDWAAIELEDLIQYNAFDSDLTLRLYWLFTDILLEEPILYNLFRNLLAPATKTLFQMEARGMLIDKQYINEAINKSDTMIKEQEKKLNSYLQVQKFIAAVIDQKTEEHIEKLQERIEKAFEQAETRRLKSIEELKDKLKKEEEREYKTESAVINGLEREQAYKLSIRELESTRATSDLIIKLDKEIQEYADRSKEIEYQINFDSPKQMHDLLYTRYGFNFDYPQSQWGEELKGTGQDVLDLIKDKSGFTTNLLIYRQMTKIYRTYLISIRDMMDQRHRVHGTFKQHGTITGRLSSAKPNMQNIITRTKYKEVEEMVSFVKKSFSTPKGHLIMQGDLSQAELRILAHYSGEEAMLQAYQDGIDLHELTAAKVRGMSVEQFRKLDEKEYKRYRYEAKSVNFGLCLVGDTKIVTDRGILRIEDIVHSKEEFMVLTHKGNWKPVIGKQKFMPEVFNNEIYVIRTRTGKEIQCTSDHMMYVSFPAANGKAQKYGWVRAEDLEEGMYLVDNKFEHKHPCNYLDPVRGLLIGWYLSEGSYSNSNARISQSRDSNPDIWERMCEILNLAGIKYRYEDSNGCFHIPAADLRKFVGKYIDINLKSRGKNFNSLYSKLGRDDKRYLLAGLWDGDGCIRHTKNTSGSVTIKYSSVSLDLINNIQDCLSSLGINSTWYKYDRDIYILSIAGSRSRKLFLDIIPTVKVKRVNYTPKKQYIAEEAISNIWIVPYDDFVYDLTVQDDNSFIANGLVSHNCYGMSAEGYKDYARTNYGLEVSLKKARDTRAAFFKSYPKLLEYHKIYIAKAKKYGYVRTFFGRKVHLPDIHSVNTTKQGHAERNAINSPIQGTAGEWTVFALVLVSIRAPWLELVNSIHDSILPYVREEDLEEAKRIMAEAMENPPVLEYFGKELSSVAMKADFETSPTSWGDLG